MLAAPADRPLWDQKADRRCDPREWARRAVSGRSDRADRTARFNVAKARLGRDEELAALKRLDDQARWLEGRAAGLDFAQLVDQERRASHANGGRSVLGWEPLPHRRASG